MSLVAVKIKSQKVTHHKNIKLVQEIKRKLHALPQCIQKGNGGKGPLPTRQIRSCRESLGAMLRFYNQVQLSILQVNLHMSLKVTDVI